mmetsp:Transcript_25291/g.75929  ORF Transcript_25291/g.75929 Transcript_25291/m.75929 type:complete len:444 (+) Transcript_25291:885-2216(+)
MQRRVRELGLAAALHDHRAAAPQRQRRDLRQRLGPRLEDDHDDAQGRAPLLEHEAVAQLALLQEAPDGVRHGRQGLAAPGHRLELGGRQAQALAQVRRHVPGRRDVRAVRLEDLGRRAPQSRPDGLEDRAPFRTREPAQGPRRGPRLERHALQRVLLEGRLARHVAREVGPDVLAAHDAREHVRPAGRHDHVLDAKVQRPERRLDLGLHAAAAGRRLAAVRDGAERRGVHLPDQPRAGRRGRPVVEALDVREEHQQVRADERRDQRREAVVVGEGAVRDVPARVARHGVVLVHDRDHADGQDGLKRRLQVLAAAAVAKVPLRHEELRGLDLERAEQRRVERHERELPRGRGRRRVALAHALARDGLAQGPVQRRLAPQAPAAAAHGARGHEDHAHAALHEARHGLDDAREAHERRRAVGVRHRRRAGLDHDGAAAGEGGARHG